MPCPFLRSRVACRSSGWPLRLCLTGYTPIKVMCEYLSSLTEYKNSLSPEPGGDLPSFCCVIWAAAAYLMSRHWKLLPSITLNLKMPLIEPGIFCMQSVRPAPTSHLLSLWKVSWGWVVEGMGRRGLEEKVRPPCSPHPNIPVPSDDIWRFFAATVFTAEL